MPASGGNYFRDVLPTLILLGAGAGASFPALTTLAMSGIEPSEAGLASGLVNTSAQVGGGVGGLLHAGAEPAARQGRGRLLRSRLTRDSGQTRDSPT